MTALTLLLPFLMSCCHLELKITVPSLFYPKIGATDPTLETISTVAAELFLNKMKHKHFFKL